MMPIHHKSLCFSILLFWVSVNPGRLPAETFGQMLHREGIKTDVVLKGDYDKPINAGSSLETGDFRILPVHVVEGSDSGTGLLGNYFYVFRRDLKTGHWTASRLSWPDQSPDAPVPRTESCSGGSITRTDAAGGFIYFGGHINPSAGCTLVATRNLEFHDTFYGWVVGEFQSGKVIFQNSLVHFAPTHNVELSLYDPRDKTVRRVYPLKPYGPVRSAYIEKVRVVYEACCPKALPVNTIARPVKDCGPKFGNHHCDPERFDNSLRGEAFTSDGEDAFIFRTVFDDLTEEHPEAVSILRHVSRAEAMQYREFLWNDLTRRYGDRPLGHYLRKDILDELFAEPASNNNE